MTLYLTKALRRDDLAITTQHVDTYDSVQEWFSSNSFEQVDMIYVGDVLVQALLEHECGQGCCSVRIPLSHGPVRL